MEEKSKNHETLHCYKMKYCRQDIASLHFIPLKFKACLHFYVLRHKHFIIH